jgi:outer membrane protein assembly factor BamE
MQFPLSLIYTHGILTLFSNKANFMRFSIFFIFFLLTACAPIQESSLIYKHDIQQGNEIDTQMLLQLKPKMTKAQVKFVLGTPLIQDSFHKDRWDYIFVLIQNGKKVERRHIILNFEKDLLKSITGEVIPSQGNNETIQAAPKVIEIDNTDKTEEESWIDNMKFWEKDDKELIDNQSIPSPEKEKQVDIEPNLERKQPPQKQNTGDVKKDASETERGWLDNLKFWEEDEPEFIEKNDSQVYEIPDGVIDNVDSKNPPSDELKESEADDYVDEILEINSQESLNENIKQDLLQDDIELMESPIQDRPNSVSDEGNKNDIMDENQNDDNEDYFDQLLEKIGF